MWPQRFGLASSFLNHHASRLLPPFQNVGYFRFSCRTFDSIYRKNTCNICIPK
jgi:hypothetical protein